MSQRPSDGLRDPVVVLHNEVLASPGGIKGAALRLGRSPGVLNNKFSESMAHYEVTLRESLAIAADLPGTAFIDAICAQFGGLFLPLGNVLQGDEDVLVSYMEIINRLGKLNSEFTEARDDGIIDKDEFSALELQAKRVVQAILKHIEGVRTLVREVPEGPAPVIPTLVPVRKG